MWDDRETELLRTLDDAVRSPSVARRLDEIASRVERDLLQKPDSTLTWEPIPLSLYGFVLPESIRSSWVFVLRANTATGAERHPNSVQRMVSYRGAGDFQTRTTGQWRSHLLESDPFAPLDRRWISIPVDVWHQGVVPAENWIVVSFHTASEAELIEERPGQQSDAVVRRRYGDQSRH